MKIASGLIILALVISMLAACGTAPSDRVCFSGGSGTESDPFIISTADDLMELSKRVNDKAANRIYAAAHYMQNKDIDLAGKDL
jgi:3-hydroxy-3-methylglutaryl CoA synthase